MCKTVYRRLLLFLIFIPILILSSVVASVASAEDIDIGTDVETNYYLTIAMDGAKIYPQFSLLDGLPFVFGLKRLDITLILNFNEVKYEGKSVLVNAVKNVAPSSAGGQSNFYFQFTDNLENVNDDVDKGNIRVNIRESYYNYFNQEQNNLTTFTVTWYYNGKGYPMYNGKMSDGLIFNQKITLSTAPKLPGDNELGDNGGLDSTPLYQKFWNIWHDFYNWCTSVFHWSISYNTFNIISLCIFASLVIGLTLSIVRKVKS